MASYNTSDVKPAADAPAKRISPFAALAGFAMRSPSETGCSAWNCSLSALKCSRPVKLPSLKFCWVPTCTWTVTRTVAPTGASRRSTAMYAATPCCGGGGFGPVLRTGWS